MSADNDQPATDDLLSAAPELAPTEAVCPVCTFTYNARLPHCPDCQPALVEHVVRGYYRLSDRT